MKLTKQEMFNRAYRGLASQGFERCTSGEGKHGCLYVDDNGRHCAWGWVDTSLTKEVSGYIGSIGGIAATLGQKNKYFAARLQQAHDNAVTPEGVKNRLKQLAKEFDLKVPRVKVRK